MPDEQADEILDQRMQERARQKREEAEARKAKD